MDAAEEVAAPPGQDKNLSPNAKGKRTKRQRAHTPISFSISPPPPTTDNNHISPRSPTFYAASSEESTTTEDVNTARCLILLSQGHLNSNRRYDEANTTAYGGTTNSAVAGSSMYTCKTCNRSFSSFQALGGHRASHKKHKYDKKPVIYSEEKEFRSPLSNNKISYNSLSLQLSSVSTSTFSAAVKSTPSPRIHECSYCGAEFTSGQALGGHMRKHRGVGPISGGEPELEYSKKPGKGLSLDLNLPAPGHEKEKRLEHTNHNFCAPLLLHHDIN